MKLLFSILRNSNSISNHLYRPINGDSLYRRISPLGDPNESIVPVLDQWIKERKHVVKKELQYMIKSLKDYRRYKHALELNLNSIPQQFKGFQTYSALVNCYGREKSVEKAHNPSCKK
ncbi:hypothetical protein H5410_049915 [Solanum commersonii]|uniref:Uncharacterized protein n=1 Tax=Solanum commersonii TaxID=4109 RepID=A0A9J5WWD3_SOLCO|nr:hypothetical protein H5410_049915 [Solanum commersonii]